MYRRYSRRLIDLAGQHLDRRLRGKVDAEDVVQSVFRSFCRMQNEGEWDGGDEKDPWPLLVQIAIRKCHRKLEEFLTAKRDVRCEADEVEPDSVDPEPTPEEAAMVADCVEAVMRRLGSGSKQRIFWLCLQGYSVQEISDEMKYYERGIERVRSDIRRLLQAMIEEDRPKK